MQLGQKADQVLQATTEPIDRPGCEHVEFAPCYAIQERIELRPLVPTFGAADAAVDELGDDRPSASFCHGPKLKQLVFRSLRVGRDPRVQGNPLRFSHGTSSLSNGQYRLRMYSNQLFS